MLLLPGPEEAVSFSDETSIDTRSTIQRSVSIYAKVRRHLSLTWLFDLIHPFQNDSRDELKAKDVLPVYLSLSEIKRGVLWETLKDVQINITDALPYQEETKQTANEAFKKENAIEFIRERALANEPFAKQLLELLNNQTAERILLDAPSRHLTDLAYYARQYPIGGYGFSRYIGNSEFDYRPPPHDIRLEKFKSKNPGAVIRTVTQWTSQSAGVFSEAIDSVSFDGFTHHPMFDPVQRALSRSHGFDRGHKNLVDLTDEERKTVADNLAQSHYYTSMEDFLPYGRLYGDLDSKKSFYVQAADIAAGIAAHLYQAGHILEVARHFEYVMFNGRRTSFEGAYETMEEWRHSGYIN